MSVWPKRLHVVTPSTKLEGNDVSSLSLHASVPLVVNVHKMVISWLLQMLRHVIVY